MHESPDIDTRDEPRVRRRVIRRPSATLPPPAAPAGGEAEPKLLRLAAGCPRCEARPAMRATRALVAALAATDANEELCTYQCQRRGCGGVYTITADAFHRAG